MKDRTENSGEIGGRTLHDVVRAAKRQMFRGKCEAAALLAIVAERDLDELAQALRRHAAAAGLEEWVGENEIEKIIAQAFETARRELAEAAK